MKKVNSKLDNAQDKLIKADSVIKSIKNKIDTTADVINNETGKLEKITEKYR
jgi:peptidoglycan hydrolase CwlO-like protein